MLEFDLRKVISDYNAVNPRRKQLKENKTWGLKYFRTEGLSVLNSIAKLINVILNEQSKRTSIKNPSNRNQVISTLKSKISAKDFFTYAKGVCKQLLTETDICKIDEWEMKQAKWLDNEENWNYLAALNTETKGSLIKLRKFWQRQSSFTFASNDFLLLILEQLKAPLDEIAKAESDLDDKRNELPKFIVHQYEQFLASLKINLQQIKEDLLNTIYCRLYVTGASYSTTGHLHKDDILVYTIEELQRLGVVKKDMQVKGHWQTLSPDHFNRFHETIQREGSEKLRRESLQLPWFNKSSKTFETKNVNIDEKTYLIPAALEPEFSSIGSWPARVLRSRKHSIKFIREHQATFAALKLGYPDVTPFEVAERFQRLDQYEQVVKDASKRIAKFKPSFWQFWSYFGYRQLISKWQELVTERREFCLNERIRLLEQMVNAELAPKDKDNRYELWLLVRRQLAQLIPHRHHELTKVMHKRLLTVMEKSKSHLEQDPEQFAKCLIRTLANNEELKEDELKYIINYVEIKELSPDKNKWFDEISAYRTKAIKALLLQTKEACNDQDTCPTSDFVVNNLMLAARLVAEEDNHLIYQTIKQIVLLQSRWLLKEKPELARERLSSLQKLVNQFGNKSLKTWMSNLPRDISDSNWKQFLSIWQNNLKLQMPSPNTSAVVATTTNAKAAEQKPFFLSWRMSSTPSTPRLSTSAPTASTKEAGATSSLSRSFY